MDYRSAQALDAGLTFGGRHIQDVYEDPHMRAVLRDPMVRVFLKDKKKKEKWIAAMYYISQGLGCSQASGLVGLTDPKDKKHLTALYKSLLASGSPIFGDPRISRALADHPLSQKRTEKREAARILLSGGALKTALIRSGICCDTLRLLRRSLGEYFCACRKPKGHKGFCWKYTEVTRKCVQCATEFTWKQPNFGAPNHSTGTYCSGACAGRRWRKVPDNIDFLLMEMKSENMSQQQMGNAVGVSQSAIGQRMMNMQVGGCWRILKHAPVVTRNFANSYVVRFEKARWPEGVICPKCGSRKVYRACRAKRGRRLYFFYMCADIFCRRQFTITSGTVFQDSRLPLRKLFRAVRLIVRSKAKPSVMRLAEKLHLNYSVAWNLHERIRKNLADPLVQRLASMTRSELPAAPVGSDEYSRTLEDTIASTR